MEPDLAAMTEEEQIAYAMRMSMAEGKEDEKVGFILTEIRDQKRQK